MPDSIQIEELAAGWLARRYSDNWRQVDQAELTTWLDISSAHRVAYIRLDAAWKWALRLGALAAGAPVKCQCRAAGDAPCLQCLGGRCSTAARHTAM
jgi:ferric-dicitrate binding protein FerR (iron transport regulator)